MRWFRRPAERDSGPAPDLIDPQQAAAQFWRHWAELLPDIIAALGDGQPHRVEHTLCELVAKVHPELQFTIERGQRAVYALVISGQEDPELRPYTDAWIAAAPDEDAIWEYHDSVPPVPDPDAVTVNLGENRFALAEVRIAAQVDWTEPAVDVAIYHPLFGELDAAARETMTFLPLEATLGERRAATWLRRVEVATMPPEGAITLLELRDLVDDLANDRTSDPGGDPGAGERGGDVGTAD